MDGDGSLIPAAVQRTRVEPSGTGVKAPRFSYVVAQSVAHAVQLLHQHGELHPDGYARRVRKVARSARRPSSSSRAVPCAIRLEPNGGVLCSVGVTEQGQGADTVMAQIAAAALGVAIDDVRVISGDTDAVPYGGGTFGSRAVAIGGEAVHRAACDLRQEILVMAGQLLQADPATVDIVDGAVVDYASGAAGVIELVGGVLLVIGLFARPAAFILSGMTAVAYFYVHAPRGLFPILNADELAALYCFVFLYLAAAGAGPLSLDRLWTGGKEQ